MKKIDTLYLNNKFYWQFKGKTEYFKTKKEAISELINIVDKNQIKVICKIDYFGFHKIIFPQIDVIHFYYSGSLAIDELINGHVGQFNKLLNNDDIYEYKGILLKIKIIKKKLNTVKKHENSKSIILSFKFFLLILKNLIYRIFQYLFRIYSGLVFKFKFNNIQYLSYKQFRKLSIYNNFNVFDFNYRYQHIKLISENFSNLKIGQIIDYFKNKKNYEELQKNIIEPKNVKLKQLYPRHCDHIFWQNGNCFYANNIIYGFRKNIANYESIESMKDEHGYIVFSKSYYESKEKMNIDEIKRLFETEPANINHKYILNSRHRIFAMIGRIVRNEDYIPIKINII